MKKLKIQYLVNIATNNFVKNINIRTIINVENGHFRLRFISSALLPVAGKNHIYPVNAIIADDSFVINMLSRIIIIVKILKAISTIPALQELQPFQKMERFLQKNRFYFNEGHRLLTETPS